MSGSSAVLLLLVLGLAVFCLGLVRAHKRKRLFARLEPLRVGDAAPRRLSRVPWHELRHKETKAAVGGVLLCVVVSVAFAFPVWSIVVLLLGVCPLAWYLVRRYRLRRFRALFAERFPEAVDGLTRAVQAGVPLERALASLGDMFEGEVGERFRRLVQHMELGVPFREALASFSEGLHLTDVDYFCAVLAISRETGSRLSPMLSSLGQTLRERRAVERKLQALTAESRAAARVLCVLPFFIVGLQVFLNPSQMRFLLNDPSGRMVLGCCAACMVAGLLIIRRMSRLAEG